MFYPFHIAAPWIQTQFCRARLKALGSGTCSPGRAGCVGLLRWTGLWPRPVFLCSSSNCISRGSDATVASNARSDSSGIMAPLFLMTPDPIPAPGEKGPRSKGMIRLQCWLLTKFACSYMPKKLQNVVSSGLDLPASRSDSD